MTNLVDPLVFFFLLGITAGLIRSDLKIPQSLYETLSIYLLLAIGLKGGVELSKGPLSDLFSPISGALFIGAVIPIIAFGIAYKIFKYSRDDSSALATHYGSVSAVTFAVCLSYLSRNLVEYDSFVTIILVVLEVPALVVGIVLSKLGSSDFKEKLGMVMHEIVTGKSLVLLIGGLLVGYFSGAEKMKVLDPVFVEPFKGALAFFLLEMGLIVARRLEKLKRSGLSLIVFSIIIPLISSVITVPIAYFVGFSLGGAVVFTTLAASASYIAAPAAVRIAIPKADPAIYITASLAITFPFNVTVGIPLYHEMVKFFYNFVS